MSTERETSTDVLFVVAGPRSSKVKCTICGRRGFMGGTWQLSCRRGHAPCELCGKQLALTASMKPRYHARCPRRADG